MTSIVPNLILNKKALITEHDRQFKYIVTLRCVGISIVAVEKQYALNVLSVCL
jgi:hypothetical protein